MREVGTNNTAERFHKTLKDEFKVKPGIYNFLLGLNDAAIDAVLDSARLKNGLELSDGPRPHQREKIERRGQLAEQLMSGDLSTMDYLELIAKSESKKEPKSKKRGEEKEEKEFTVDVPKNYYDDGLDDDDDEDDDMDEDEGEAPVPQAGASTGASSRPCAKCRGPRHPFAVLAPCGHAYTCEKCAKTLKHCPIPKCFTPVQSFIVCKGF